VLIPIMDTRVSKCRQAGFDGVEWDNVDGYSNRSGFPLVYADQLAYDAMLANVAHHYGLTVAIKNDVEQLADLAPYVDYAVNEQCQQYRECGGYDGPFIGAGKAVFQVEYKLSLAKFCPQANAANRNAILKDFDLFDTPYTPCRLSPDGGAWTITTRVDRAPIARRPAGPSAGRRARCDRGHARSRAGPQPAGT